MSSLVRVACVALLFVPVSLQAQNRYYFESGDLMVGSTGNQISLRADLDQDAYAFSVHVRFSAADLEITAASLGSDAAALSPEYFEGEIDNTTGAVVYGAVFDLSDPVTKHLTAGNARELLSLSVDVDATSPKSSALTFQNDTTPPWSRNVLTDGAGNTVAQLTLENMSLSITSLAPVIDDINSNSGRPGETFFIVGQNFDQPGRTVTVGGRPGLNVSLLGDGVTLSVDAPDCDDDGLVTVEVCNNFGCDSDAAGFDYDCPGPPVISTITSNSGPPGDTFVINGEEFDEPGLSVRVGGIVATDVTVNNASRLTVTAPACVDEGAAEVEVCTDLGCDDRASGYTYTSGCTNSPQPPVITAIADNAGSPGDSFTVEGDNFTEPGLIVRVGGRPSPNFVLRADNRTIDVEAPDCDADGFATVQVCTNFGCDDEANGFDYDCPDAPVIENVSPSSGEPGTPFVIEGTDLDRAGVTVSVGGVSANVTINGDGSLDVVAPACASEGSATIEVCTDRGCDSLVNGFEYTGGCSNSDQPPVISSVSNNSGFDGDIFTVIGANFDEPGLLVRVGGQDAVFTVGAGDNTSRILNVTAPPCVAAETVAVQVCTNFGCDTESNGFTYESCGGDSVGPFLRGDCNQDGESAGSPTDGIFLLTFLFIGGVPPSCLAACDMDGSGEVEGSPTDALFFFNFNFLGGSPIPPPQVCGESTDPKDIAIGCVDPRGCS